jgi:hypothetical protein
MSAPCQQFSWAAVKDDTPFVRAAIAEWNLGQPAWTKPAKTFADLPASAQSWVLMRAAELRMQQAG